VETAAVPERLGEFAIEGVLGQGGSGTVYAASWGPRKVALKVLSASLVSTERERAQWVTEAKRLQAIAHASVVKVFTVGTLADGRPYLAMERLVGDTLAGVLGKGPLPLADALALLGELCGAVDALHAQGLIHRDLKPENVFVVSGEEGAATARHAVLLDFGIAKDLDAPASTTTQEGNVRGTPAYMAPERFFGQPAGVATDIYELALVLYAMLAARLPWDNATDPEARLAPTPLTEYVAVPPALDVELRRALSTRAQNRPASAGALYAAIRATVASGGSNPLETARMRPAKQSGEQLALANTVGVEPQPTPLAWAPTQAAPATTSQSRRRSRVAIFAAGVVAIAALGAGALWRSSRGSAHVAAGASTRSNDGGATTPHAVGSANGLIATGTSGSSAAPDPWSTPSTPTVKAPPLVAPAASSAVLHAEARAAIHHLPADTQFILSAQIGELRSQRAIADVLTRLGADPRLQMLLAIAPPCIRAIASDADWIVFGSPSMNAAGNHGTMILRGRWARSDLEQCFASTGEVSEASPDHLVYHLSGAAWIDFVDDHTLYATLDDHATVATVHARASKPGTLPAHVEQLLASVPAASSFAVVASGEGNDHWADLMAIPDASDVLGHLIVDADGAGVDAAVDTHAELSAKGVEGRVRPQIDEVFHGASAGLGKLEVVRTRSTVRVRGHLSAMMLGLLLSGL